MSVPSSGESGPNTSHSNSFGDSGNPSPFSFFRPSTADQSQSAPDSRGNLIPPPSQPVTLSPPGSPLDFGSPPDPNPDTPHSRSGLSPAASYAKKVQYPGSDLGEWKAPDTTSTEARRALSFQTTDPSSGYGAGESDPSKTSESSGIEEYKGAEISMKQMGRDFLPAPARPGTTITSQTLSYLGGDLEEDEDSPYPEVRASVSNFDDPELPCLTFRTWFLGLGLSMLFGGANMFFNLRWPAPYIQSVLVLVVAFPLGKFMAWLLPTWEITVPKPFRFVGGKTWSLNPGPFNIKENTLIFIMANASTSPGYSLDISIIFRKTYNVQLGSWFDLLFLLSTQMIGFAIAGFGRRFLVSPASMIWPQNLTYCTLLNTFHAEDDDEEGGKISRFRFFLVAFWAAFAWYFVPGFLFQALSVFSYICWAAPNNVVVNQLFGVFSGLGMGVLTFDWSQINFVASPLFTPWWAEVNIFFGFVLTFWIIVPILYYTNTWYTAYLPISTAEVFDRFGLPYNTSAIIDPITQRLDESAYKTYSPLFISVGLAMKYMMILALATAVLVHTGLYHGHDIWNRLSLKRKVEDDDIHVKLMRNYREIPEWWFLAAFFLWLAVAIGVCAGWETHLPIWALLLSILLSAIFVLPAGYVFAMTGQIMSLSLLSELLAGFIIPQNPLGVMIFRTYATDSLGLGACFLQSLKMGHYMKIPPRVNFAVQLIATAVTCLAQFGVTEGLLHNVPDFCTEENAAFLSCPWAASATTASIVWGLVGSKRLFGIGQMYNPILWSLLIGAVLPVVFWYLERRFPRTTWLSHVNIPIFLIAGSFIPGATGINYGMWFLFGFIFRELFPFSRLSSLHFKFYVTEFWIRRRHFAWWSKYNFILSSALDTGTAISGIFIFLTLQIAKNGTIGVEWFGNDIFTKNADWNGLPFKNAPESGFGPTTW